jgi:tape measure domain-containing protein
MTALELVISLKDRTASTLEKIGREFTQVRTNADKLSTTIGHLEAHGQNLRIARDSATSISELRRLNRELELTEQKVTKLQNVGRGGGLKGLIGQIPGGDLLLNPIAIAAAGIGVVSKLGIEAEKTSVAFDVLLGSHERATKMVEAIKQYGDTSPYESPALLDNAKTMLAFGIAQEKVLPSMKMLGDIAMGDANKMNSMVLAFSQISSAGKMQGQDLLQLVNVGFNPLNELTKMTGKSMAELRKEMEQGKISADMVTAAFQHATGPGGQFYGMTDKIANTVGGRLSTSFDNLKRIGLGLFDLISPVLIPALNLFGFLVGVVATAINWLAKEIKEGNPIIIGLIASIAAIAIASNAAAIASGVATLATKIWTGAQWLLNIAMDANPIGLIIAAIAILVGLVWAAVKAYDKWGATLLFLMGPLGLIVNMIMALKNNWDSIVQAFTSDGILGGLKRIGVVLIDAVLYPIQQLLGLLSNIPGMGKLAGRGEAYLATLRKNLNLATPQSATSTVSNETGDAASADATSTGKNKSTTSAVASGGSRSTQISIHLGKMVENIVFQGGVKENARDMEAQVEEILLRVLFAAQSAG